MILNFEAIRMANKCFVLIAFFYCSILAFQASAVTDVADVEALRDLYRSLNSPVQLRNWTSEGAGDPCAESWTGVQCFGAFIINLNLRRLNLTGNLGYQLSNLKSLNHLDVSSNNIEGAIPYNLPLNVTILNLAENRFTQSIPSSIESMKRLRHLNVSHNLLSGPLGAVFNGLENLKDMDLSFNNLTGDLPTSFRLLVNLTGLFLQGNQFTGSVVFLAHLPLSNLNIEDNHFSGVIPEKFQDIPNLWIAGNKFDKATDYPPWKFPTGTSNRKNISSPPATNLSAFLSYPSNRTGHTKKRSHAAGIALIVSVMTLLAAVAALVLVVQIHRLRGQKLRRSFNGEDSTKSLPISSVQDYSSMAAEDSPYESPFSSSPMITPSRLPPIRTKTMKSSKRKSFSKSKMPICAKAYTVAELQTATNSFSEDNLIGEGSLGSVYRAEFTDGTILAVKNINTVPLSIIEEQQFFDVIRSASCLKHPNIVKLIGYCMEHGQHLIVYEYIRSLSLHEVLHCAAYKPLSWGIRLRIALGIARSLNYMHSACVPPVAHSNLKAANILLDEDLIPHVSDCGLSMLRPLASNTVKLKASEMAIADSGYIAPEHVQPGTANTKADVYAFGVLLLELLTGRKPIDSSRPKSEQSLVRWASSRLHDTASLGQMIDPAISRTISSKSLSRFADIISMCIQTEQEFRPPMSEIVESLMCMLQKPGAVDGIEPADVFERSFRSTNSRFFGSPTLSYYSV